MIVALGYVWVFFTDWTPGHDSDWIGVARAPVARASEPAAYRKFNGSTWTAALGGAGRPVIRRPTETDKYAGDPTVSYNSALGAFLVAFETSKGFYTATSNNLISWARFARLMTFSVPRVSIADGDLLQTYPTLLDARVPGSSRTGSSLYLYFAQGRRNMGPHHLVRRWV